MNFDDHEIWGAPVRASESTPDSAGSEPAAPAAVSAGRLYRSAGSEPHPEAILALPNHRRHTAVHPMPASPAPTVTGQAPITINSRLPRTAAVEDPAIAEVLGTPKAASPVAGFTGWFKQSAADGDAAPAGTSAEPTSAPAAPRPGLRPLAGVATLPLGELGASGYALLLTAITTLVGVVEAVVSDGIGMATGLTLVLATAAGAWRVATAARWIAWVMPAYALTVTALIAGQFGAGAPGASLVGQAMLVVTGLISLAPWLALAAIAGVVVPLVRGRRR